MLTDEKMNGKADTVFYTCLLEQVQQKLSYRFDIYFAIDCLKCMQLLSLTLLVKHTVSSYKLVCKFITFCGTLYDVNKNVNYKFIIVFRTPLCYTN